MRAILSILINAVALWVVTLILQAHVQVIPFEESTWGVIGTLALFGLIWGVVNAVVGGVVRVVAFPLYILTLGLISFIVNGFLFWLVGVISDSIGFGIEVSGFWWAVLAALIMSVVTAVLGGWVRGADSKLKSDERRRREA
ncbi:hypothetical protein C5E07_14650 [Pseudoclavibacter sp. RFBJ3]|uniref:phage holin family protein n=1 Tax=unclassified Pseudoclavibacter TaxID=2615177 RepID=UPI000CE8AD7F|nr:MULTISPECIES: phage holin family protein [unclassified Pseudoclavibacter]MBF4459206.1 phage holin family protein [Pseudoclavibacter sp. VKM Ac-2867]MBF4551106.1 phage holin family protein [Pseudoclavibacter sp. VKM Ac-2888]PPF36101.1 hypothetical protein C5E05_11470 [Pseudoclavibacter sp. AY1H1]PPF73473.1 hypothetical protein C5B99_16050 [Pseudoclavibacter sp. Z016]PPF81507.1 hypothetical protein C5C12_14390 [Pseudoclavibacter sp. RFBJ5]